MSAMDSLEESLSLLGIASHEKESFVRGSLLALRGWAGMIWQTEERPDRVYIPSRHGTLIEFLAIRLILERYALQWLSRETLDYKGPLDRLREFIGTHYSERDTEASVEQRAFPILQLAQLHGWTPQTIAELSDTQWQELVHAVENFSSFERRRVFHLAFERKLMRLALDSVAIRASQPQISPKAPQLQVITCIDAREESFRRHSKRWHRMLRRLQMPDSLVCRCIIVVPVKRTIRHCVRSSFNRSTGWWKTWFMHERFRSAASPCPTTAGHSGTQLRYGDARFAYGRGANGVAGATVYGTTGRAHSVSASDGKDASHRPRVRGTATDHPAAT